MFVSERQLRHNVAYKVSEGSLFRGYFNAEILQFLATYMKSPAVLESTCAWCDSDNFAQIVNDMARAVEERDIVELCHRVAITGEKERRNSLMFFTLDTATKICRKR